MQNRNLSKLTWHSAVPPQTGFGGCQLVGLQKSKQFRYILMAAVQDEHGVHIFHDSDNVIASHVKTKAESPQHQREAPTY